MERNNTYRISKLIKLTVAMLLAAGVLILSVSAVGNKDKEKVSDIQVNLTGSVDAGFVSKKEIRNMLRKAAGKELKDQSIGALDLSALEVALSKHAWISKAEMFIDNRNILRVNIEQHRPVARVFSKAGNSFYLSEKGRPLPMVPGVAVRIPVFTGFSGNLARLNKQDSALLADMLTLSNFISSNDFWMSQIDQIDITPSEKFEMIPKLGNQVIRFGDAGDFEEKFRKLLAFYNQVVVKTGWNKYRLIDLQYHGQIVAEKRDAAEVKADSMAAIRIMKAIIENAKKSANDSTFIQLPEKPGVPAARPRPAPAGTDDTDDTDDTINEIIPEKSNTPERSVSPISNAGADEPKQEMPAPKAVMAAPEKKASVPVAAPAKPVKTEKVVIKKEEKKAEKRIPKAVMPSKNKEQ